MFEKDYYQVLQLQPTASAADIRKAYRRLALEFHPDKNNTQQAAAQFVLIREAYAVLSDPVQRRKYDLSRFAGQPTSRRIATTPAEVRLMSEELVERIKRNNPDRINRDKLAQDIEAILCVYHIQLLNRIDEERNKHLLIIDLLFCLQYLPKKDCIRLINTIHSIQGLDNNSLKKIELFYKKYHRDYYWNRYKILLALFIALLVCLFIYYA